MTGESSPRTDLLEARNEKFEARLDKIEAMLYEEGAKQREQQIHMDSQQAQIESMRRDRNQLHSAIGRWAERIIFGAIAAAAWFWDRLVGQ